MMGWYDGSGWGGWLVMSAMMMVLWGFVIFGAVVGWKALRRDDLPRDSRGDAQRLLDERLARGEIEIDDYNQRRALLGPPR